MLIVPVSVVCTGIFCVLYRCCLRICCDSGQQERSSSSLSPSFEEMGSDDNMRIPLRRNNVSYASISTKIQRDEEASDEVSGDASDEYSCDDVSDLDLDFDDKVKSVEMIERGLEVREPDTKAPLLPDSESCSPCVSISPPDLFLMSASDALKAYSKYIHKSAKMAHGPEVVCVSTLKSKSFFAGSTNDEENVHNEMNAFDERYEESQKKFLTANNLQAAADGGRMRGSSSAEKRVLFNSMKDIRSFTKESSKEDDEEEE